MTVLLFFLGIAQCFFIWWLGYMGAIAQTRGDREKARASATMGWPRCAVIIPVSGQHPAMETALRSLLEQDYPDYHVYMVTASADDPARALVDRLGAEYGNLTPVTAGQSEHRGQKNHNLLAGIAAAGDGAEVYAFCDSTHVASRDFLRCLVFPLSSGESAFSTGYHQVVPRDDRLATLAYAASVLFMRLMQSLAPLTQPWGGAMAMTKKAFISYKVADLWSHTVVDDCSLGALLQKEGVQVRFCPAALLTTYVSGHAFPVWQAWLERQILFLKFCIRPQWIMLVIFSALMALPPLWCAIAVLRGLMNMGGGMAPFLALCWFCLMVWSVGGWRKFIPAKTGPWRWLTAFFCACAVFALVCFRTISQNSIVWHNIVYSVGDDGTVKNVERR